MNMHFTEMVYSTSCPLQTLSFGMQSNQQFSKPVNACEYRVNWSLRLLRVLDLGLLQFLSHVFCRILFLSELGISGYLTVDTRVC